MGQTRMADKIEKQVAELLAKAEAGDSAPLEDGLTLPEEIARRQDRPEQLRAANKVIRARAKERYERGLAEFQAQEEESAERTGKKPRGRAPKPPGPGQSIKPASSPNQPGSDRLPAGLNHESRSVGSRNEQIVGTVPSHDQSPVCQMENGGGIRASEKLVVISSRGDATPEVALITSGNFGPGCALQGDVVGRSRWSAVRI